MTDEWTISDYEIETEVGILTGTAIFSYELEEMFDADIGGRDGPECTDVKFLGLREGNVYVSAAWIKPLAPHLDVEKLEEQTRGEIQETIDAGELS